MRLSIQIDIVIINSDGYLIHDAIVLSIYFNQYVYIVIVYIPLVSFAGNLFALITEERFIYVM